MKNKYFIILLALLASCHQSSNEIQQESTKNPETKKSEAAHDEITQKQITTTLLTREENLIHAANSGSHAASCKLAVEYSICTRINETIRSLPKKDTQNSNIELNYLSNQEIDLLTRCQDLRHESPSRIIEHWRNAAQSGDDRYIFAYASGQAFNYGNILDNLSNLAIYKEEAEKMMLESASKGNAGAAMALANAYNPSEAIPYPLLTQATGKNPVKAYAIYTHLSHSASQRADPEIISMIESKAESIRKTLNHEQIMAAREISIEISSEWINPDFDKVQSPASIGRLEIRPDRNICD